MESGTTRFMNALERQDLDAVAELLAPDVTWTLRMTMDGSQRPSLVQGREQVTAKLREITSQFDRVAFTDQRVSLVEGGTTAFVQVNGDFHTVDGRAYRNVYVFRFDWRDGKMSAWEEYANPVTIRNLEQPHA